MAKTTYWKKVEDTKHTEKWISELTFTHVILRKVEGGYNVEVRPPRYHDNGDISVMRNDGTTFSTKERAREQAMFHVTEDFDMLMEDVTAEGFAQGVESLFLDDKSLISRTMDEAVDRLEGTSARLHDGRVVMYGADYSGSFPNYSLFYTHEDERNPIASQMVSWFEVNPINLDAHVHDEAVLYFEENEDMPEKLLSVTGLIVSNNDRRFDRQDFPENPHSILKEVAGRAGKRVADRYRDKSKVEEFE